VTQPVLSTRALNRALLARQFLLRRADLPIPRLLERIGGIQAQYAPSGYIGLWSRLSGLQREALTRAMEERKVVTATLMRTTIHLVSARDFALMAAGTRRARQEWWLRVFTRRVERREMEAMAQRLGTHLADGPRRRIELVKLLEGDGFPPEMWTGAGLWLDMVRVPPSSTWERRRADIYGLASQWLPPATASEADGMVHLLRRYLEGFGPAPLEDAASWAGFSPSALRPALDGLRLRRFRDQRGRELLDLPGAVLPDPDTPVPVRFLPTWDATLLAHARRTEILPETYRPMVFATKTPQSVPTFLVDGAVAGTWRYQAGAIKLAPFHPLARATRIELEEEAERLAAFHSDTPG
jgi:hypothetical protein